ncbi:hypothetical protein [Roseomonas gilardii]|uniref:hypothetical protein n=1 Tax=Roseomonas gilardii TaxID=257708 RepID=UPI0012EB098C|nr:hypothetical protein [Roseomonas gilardii]
MVVCLAAAGCANPAQQRAQDTAATFDTVRAGCAERFPQKLGNYLSKARCEADAQMAAMTANGFPADLASLFIAKRASIAGSIDRGAISPEEGDLQIAQVRTEIIDRQQARRNAALSALAMEPPPMMQAPTYRPIPTPTITNCNPTFGGGVSCTTTR